jgi:RNA polymerase sigma factor (TIGR02999 family)
MENADRNAITQLLNDAKEGNRSACERLLAAVYAELRRLAAGHMARERDARTLQSTALVHEAYLRLVDQENADWRSRAHFFGAASNLMRQILVDHARAKHAEKRGGDRRPVSFEEQMQLSLEDPDLILAVNQALERLHERDRRQAEIVEKRFFGGLSVEEVAEVMGIGTATVKREWSMAKAWLSRELSASGSKS